MAISDFSINLRSKTPLSDQLRERIRQMIAENILMPGDQLPTVRSLASQLQVHFNTVARAYRELDAEGLIYTHQGRGAFVTDKSNLQSASQAERADPIAPLIEVLEETARRNQATTREILELVRQRIERKKVGFPHAATRRNRISPKKRIRFASENVGFAPLALPLKRSTKRKRRR